MYLGGKTMSTTKKQKSHSALDKYEQDIENNLDPREALLSTEKIRKVAKLKAAAKEHMKKKTSIK